MIDLDRGVASTPGRAAGLEGAAERFGRAVARAGAALVGVALVCSLVTLGWLARLERFAPAHAEIEMRGGIPATFYVQGRFSYFGLPEPPPPGLRPPAVVLCHGFSGDRAMMSTLARRLAAAGYAVLAIDARGHGENRNRFDGGGDGSGLHEDLATAVEYLRDSPHADGGRIAVMGHSMGAGASLEYATRDPGLSAAVMISGGFRTTGSLRPPNALFIYAQRDPENLRHASDVIAGRLRGGDAGEPRRDDFRGRTAVRVVEVPEHDHVTILWSSDATRQIIGWLDASFGVERAYPADLGEPRMRAAVVAFAAFLVVLSGIGWVVGRLAPPWPGEPARGAAARLGLVTLVLVATLSLSASHVMTAPLSLPVAQEVGSFFLLAGAALLVGMQLLGAIDVRWLARTLPASAGAATVGIIAIAAGMTPLGVVMHRLTLTPGRAVAAGGLFLALLPLYVALELLLRRGGTLAASLTSATGRIVVVAILLIGTGTGLLPWVIDVMLPTVAAIFLLGEILAGPIYAVSRNRLVVALVQAAWFAWLIAATMAIRS